MATKTSTYQQRRANVLSALDMVPLTTRQLLAFSESFAKPFKDESTLRHYLSALRSQPGGCLVQSFPYAVESEGRPPVYWKLTRDGYRFLYGPRAEMPRRRYFERVSRMYHEHTMAIAEFLVKTVVSSHRLGIHIERYRRENSYRVDVPRGRPLWPDGEITLRDPEGQRHRFLLELDNGTERIQSSVDTESIQRKIDGYDRHQAQFDSRDPDRYFVLFVTTRTPIRVAHILETAKARMKTPERSVFLATDLDTYLRCANPLRLPCFVDNAGRHRPLITQSKKRQQLPEPDPTCVTRSLSLC